MAGQRGSKMDLCDDSAAEHLPAVQSNRHMCLCGCSCADLAAASDNTTAHMQLHDAFPASGIIHNVQLSHAVAAICREKSLSYKTFVCVAACSGWCGLHQAEGNILWRLKRPLPDSQRHPPRRRCLPHISVRKLHSTSPDPTPQPNAPTPSTYRQQHKACVPRVLGCTAAAEPLSCGQALLLR
jgi:hypothetical protein